MRSYKIHQYRMIFIEVSIQIYRHQCTEEYFKIIVHFTVINNFITSIRTIFLNNQNSILFQIHQLTPSYLNDKSEKDIFEGASFYLPKSLNFRKK